MSAGSALPAGQRSPREREYAELRDSLGNVLRTRGRVIDVAPLLPAAARAKARLPGRIERTVVAVLEDYLSDNGWFWRESGTAFGIVYPNLLGPLLALKHRALGQAVERAVKQVVGDPADGQAVREKSPPPRPSRRLAQGPFLEFCRKKKVTATQIHTLDLAEALFGETEPGMTLSKRAKGAIADVLDDYLSLQGHYTVLNDTQILLAFPNLGRGLGELKRNAIAMEIARRLEAPTQRPAEDDDAVEEKLRALRLRRGHDHRAEPTVPRDDPSSSLAVPRPVDEIDAEQKKMWDRALAAMSSGYTESIDLTSFPPDRSVVFAPVWRVTGHLLAGHVMQAAEVLGDGGVVPLGGVRRTLDQTSDTHPLDLPMIARATGHIRGTDPGKPIGLMIVPVHFRTLERASLRSLFLEICSRLDREQRRFLVLELAGVPGDLAPFLLEECLAQLRPFCRAVIGRAQLSSRDLNAWRGKGLHAIGLDLAHYKADEAPLMKGMDDFMDATSAIGARTYINGLRTTSLATAAIASGFDYLSGAAIAPLVQTPDLIRRYETRELYTTSSGTPPEESSTPSS